MTNERIAERQVIGALRAYTEDELREIRKSCRTWGEEIRRWCHEEAARYVFLWRDAER